MLSKYWNDSRVDHSPAADLKLWYRLVDDINTDFKYMPGTFFENNEKVIDRLFREYYRTNSGSSPNTNIGIRQKFRILQNDKVFDQLESALDAAERAHAEEWDANQLRDESLDARLEREKEAASSAAPFRISKRQI
jgi:hypothetical protein